MQFWNTEHTRPMFLMSKKHYVQKRVQYNCAVRTSVFKTYTKLGFEQFLCYYIYVSYYSVTPHLLLLPTMCMKEHSHFYLSLCNYSSPSLFMFRCMLSITHYPSCNKKVQISKWFLSITKNEWMNVGYLKEMKAKKYLAIIYSKKLCG